MDTSWLDHETVTITLRLLIAGVLCGLIGIEREVKRHPAGFRTHLLVGVGSCLLMLLSIFGFEGYLQAHPNITGFDPSRMPAYVVSGIGFLGAGTILVHGVTVRGLTTAASIWVVAGIGLVVGIGMYYPAILTTIIVILSLFFLNKWESVFIKTQHIEGFYLLIKDKKLTLSRILEIMESYSVVVKKVAIEAHTEENQELMKYRFKVIFSDKSMMSEVFDQFNKLDEVYKVYTTE